MCFFCFLVKIKLIHNQFGSNVKNTIHSDWSQGTAIWIERNILKIIESFQHSSVLTRKIRNKNGKPSVGLDNGEYENKKSNCRE